MTATRPNSLIGSNFVKTRCLTVNPLSTTERLSKKSEVSGLSTMNIQYHNSIPWLSLRKEIRTNICLKSLGKVMVTPNDDYNRINRIGNKFTFVARWFALRCELKPSEFLTRGSIDLFYFVFITAFTSLLSSEKKKIDVKKFKHSDVHVNTQTSRHLVITKSSLMSKLGRVTVTTKL